MVTHSRTHKLKIPWAHPARFGDSRLDPSTHRKRAADDRLDGPSRSANGAGATGHDCEQIAHGIGCQSGQEPWQVAAGVHISQGRIG